MCEIDKEVEPIDEEEVEITEEYTTDEIEIPSTYFSDEITSQENKNSDRYHLKGIPIIIIAICLFL